MSDEMIFIYRLAGHLKKSVQQILQLSAIEFAGWIQYDGVEPIGLDWLRTGMTCQTIARCMTGESCEPQDFMPIEREDKTEEIFNAMLSVAKRK